MGYFMVPYYVQTHYSALQMKNYCFDSKRLGIITLLAVGGVFLGIMFLDRFIALGVMELLNSSPLLKQTAANMPSFLLLPVCIGSVALWTAYFSLVKRGVANEQTRFLKLASVAVPVAYLMKSPLQFAFGQINTRVWPLLSGIIKFRYFRGFWERGGFPSGHMLVFTAFVAAVWCCYPRYRILSASLLFILGVTLIATNHHFLSDVIAGVYAGLLVTVVSIRCLEKSC
jgi:membrane-associated phospholipid phosphatase